MELEIIDNDKLAEITGLLKTHIPNWAETMSKDISKDLEWKKEVKKNCNITNVYNLAQGKVDSQFRRRIFSKCAAKLLLDASQKTKEVSANLDVVLS